MKTLFTAAVLVAALAGTSLAQAQAVVGQPAPAFQLTDVTGKSVQLSDFAGKHVVLEWVNPSCPFVKKHYDSGNMPATQKAAMSQGVVWLTIHTGDKSAAELGQWLKAKDAAPTAAMLDGKGSIGKAYGARVTPHMFLIDPQGKLVYAGAIDSKPSTNAQDIKMATNYVSQAVTESLAGKAISQPVSAPYGCVIHY